MYNLGFYNNNNSECNRCELAGVRNSFLTPALRLDRIETLAQSGTAIVVIMKITEGNLVFYSIKQNNLRTYFILFE